MTDFRQEIKRIQEQKGVSTHTLAKRAGLKTSATLYNYLNEKSDMTSGNLQKVLDALNSLPDRIPDGKK